jgi:hypothetical protein
MSECHYHSDFFYAQKILKKSLTARNDTQDMTRNDNNLTTLPACSIKTT